MKNLIIATAIVALAPVASAKNGMLKKAQDKAADAKDQVENTIDQAKLQGTWINKCSASDLLNLSEQIEYRFLADGFEKRVLLYADSDCKNVGAEIKMTGSATVGDSGKDSFQNLDLDLEQVEVKAVNTNVQNLFNRTTFCGFDNWQAGNLENVTDVSGNGICQFGKFPRTEYKIFKVEGDKVFFGSNGYLEATKKEDRPSKLDKETPFTR